MSNIIETLKGYISPELISQTSSSLGESPGNVRAALTSAFPSILGGLLNKSSDPRSMGGLLDMAKNQSEEMEPGQIFSKLNSQGGRGLIDRGRDFMGSLFGNKSGDVANAIGISSGIKSSSATSILAIAAPIVMGFVGSKARSGNWGVSNMVGFLKEQKDNIVSAMPAGVGNMIGGAKSKVQDTNRRVSYEERKSTPWFKYIIYAAIAGIILFVINRSCTRDARQEVTPMKNTKTGGARPGASLNMELQQLRAELYEMNL